MTSFFKGAFLLVAVAFMGECIEFFINMVLANQLGESGLGLYMSILPIIFLVVVLASMELPISISKFVAEKDEKYHRSMLKHVIRFTVYFSLSLIALSVIILPLIPVFRHYNPYIRGLIVLLIPIISFSSIARGYFMGIQHMGKIAAANFLRKSIQLILLIAVYHYFHFDLEVSILIAICTIVGSDFIVLLYWIHTFVLQSRYIRKRNSVFLSGKTVRKSLMSVSLTTTGMRMFNAFSEAFQPFLIKAALVKAGFTAGMANEHFGMLAGVAFTIGFFPAFIAHSLSTVLIPTVSEAYSQKEIPKLQRLLQQVMLITIGYGVPAVIIFNVFSEPLTRLFFHTASAAHYLELLWPFFLFHFFVTPMQAILIGIGMVKDVFLHFVWATIVTFLMSYMLGSSPFFQMSGIIIGMNTGALLLLLLHYLTICKKIGISLGLRRPANHSF
jgi:stage V sporulation protein B